MASWTPSQPGGAGAGALNKDLEDVRVGVQVLLTAQAQASYVWSVFDKPDAASTVTIVNATSQVANVTFASKGIYGIELSDPATGTSKVLYLEVNRDAAGDLIDHGLVAPALAQGQATSVTGRGVARTMERFAAAVLVAIAAGGGGGANLDPAGPLALGTANATSVAIGRTAAPLTVLGSTTVVRAAADAEYSGSAGSDGLFVTGGVTGIVGAGGITLDAGPEQIVFTSGGLVEASGGGLMFSLGGGVFAGQATGDTAPYTMEINSGDASAAAVSNLVGAKLRMRGGRGKTGGTHKYGDVEISLGRADSATETAKLSVRYSTAGSDPFASELLSLAKGSGGTGAVMTFPLGSSSIVGATITNSSGIASTTGSQGGSLFFSTFSPQVLKGYQVPSDAAALDVEVQGAAAFGTAVTNTTGGKVRIRGGAGTTGGTHKHGDVQISVGRTIADGSTAKLAVTFGTSTDPFATELVSFSRGTSGQTSVTSAAAMTFSASTGTLAFNAQAASGSLDFRIAGNELLVVNVPTGTTGKFAFRDGGSFTAVDLSTKYDGEVSFVTGPHITGLSLRLAAPTADKLAPALLLKGADATTFVTATAAHKRGGAIVLAPGRGYLPGTDPAGPVYIGLGEQESATTSVSNGVILGFGPAVGTPGAADYKPFDTEVMRIRTIANQAQIYTTFIQIEATGNAQLRGQSQLLLYGGGSGVTCSASGALNFSSSASSFTAGCIGALSLDSGSGVSIRRWGVGVERFAFRTPAAVNTNSVARSVLLTVAVPTGAILHLKGTVKGWPSTGAGQATTFDIYVENNGGVLTKRSESIANVAGTATLGTVDATISGTSITIGVTPGAATAYTWHANENGDT